MITRNTSFGFNREAAFASKPRACRQAKELTRPQGHLGPAPSELWSGHPPISPEQRQRFRAAIERYQEQIVAEKKETINPKNKNHQAQVYRHAVRRALLELGLLTTTRRSISSPLKRKLLDKIS